MLRRGDSRVFRGRTSGTVVGISPCRGAQRHWRTVGRERRLDSTIDGQDVRRHSRGNDSRRGVAGGEAIAAAFRQFISPAIFLGSIPVLHGIVERVDRAFGSASDKSQGAIPSRMPLGARSPETLLNLALCLFLLIAILIALANWRRVRHGSRRSKKWLLDLSLFPFVPGNGRFLDGLAALGRHPAHLHPRRAHGGLLLYAGV